ncbi:hypothetical protein [Streptomyces sp. NPDC056982]|uniref:hypothetical protein n=1 Tax=Streptomyces sp. NPDC056982 TaxID=3345986 RepID=UPI00363E87AC
MDSFTAAVIIVAIMGLTVVFVVKFLSSTPARIAAVLGAVAVLFGVIPRIIAPLATASVAPGPSATVTVPPEPWPAATHTGPAGPASPGAGEGGAF